MTSRITSSVLNQLIRTPNLRSRHVYARAMSSKTSKPEILGTDDLKAEAKWLKLQKIRWKDQEGKEVRNPLDDV
jgi:hypothetical protein